MQYVVVYFSAGIHGCYVLLVCKFSDTILMNFWVQFFNFLTLIEWVFFVKKGKNHIKTKQQQQQRNWSCTKKNRNRREACNFCDKTWTS